MIYRVSSAHEEGGERLYSVNTEKFLGRSLFDAPHRILIDGSYTIKPTRTDLTVIYDGHSGAPYDYVYASGATNSGDLNADGYQGNDLLYVPTDVTDLTSLRRVGVLLAEKD